MNLFGQIRDQVVTLLQQLVAEKLLPEGLDFTAVDVMPPRDAAHGDMATNAAMVLAKKAAMPPRALAELLAGRLKTLARVEAAEIAGPGFINLRFQPGFWQEVITSILAAGVHYGDSTVGAGRKVNVEYVSANPTGPMHVGHGRGAVVGDALASLLAKVGFAVTREYYINDAGAQVDVLARSAYLRYREACGEAVGDIPEGLYPGDYLVPVGQALFQSHGKALLDKAEAEWLQTVRDFTLARMMELVQADLAQLGIRHDIFTSERHLTQEGRIEEALGVLEGKGLVYTGVLEPPKGKPVPEDWEPRPQVLFKSTLFGDDMDRALKKSDGSWTYFAPDIAYHYDKIKRGFLRMVDVLGADHGGYGKRIQAAVKALSGGEAALEVRLCQLVKFLRAGEPVKMSKRKGTFMTVREVVDEVGNGVFRFIMLTRDNNAPLEFDFAKVMEQSKDNPVFYVQYAHARAKSALRMGEQEGVAASLSGHPTEAQLALLTQGAELELLRLMAGYPRMLEAAALASEPHRVAFYLMELAAGFHSWWNQGNSDISLRFIRKDAIDLTVARLALVRASATVIASGLHVLGVAPLEEMR